MKTMFFVILTLGHLVSFGQLKAYSDTCSIGLPKTKETFTIPEVRAEYPGGFKKMLEYITINVTQKISVTKSEFDVFNTPVAQWTIDENGNVSEVKIIKTSNITKIDNLYLSAIKGMPTWKPAEKYGKIKTREEFRYPLKICFK